jgi:RNA polymerase sigma factor (sigma-70 family)
MKWQSAPRQLNYRNLLESWELRILECEVSQYCGHQKAFPEDEREDVIQQLVIRWISERDAWDPDRGKRESFMRTVVRNDLRDLIEERQAEKRCALGHAKSLHGPADDDPDGPPLEELLPDEKADHADATELRADLVRALAKLTDRQRRILNLLLDELDVTAIAKRLGLSRSTVHDDRTRIRQLFERHGLRAYLKKSPDTLD